MRMMMKVAIPVDTGNQGVKDGVLQKTIGEYIERYRPESTYFTAANGLRTMYSFFDLKETSSIPSIAEPFFNRLNASITVIPAMNVEDLKVGMEKLKSSY